MKRLDDLYPHLLGHKSTIDATYCLARMAIELDVPGDFVEAGVYAGAQSAAMARAIMDADLQHAANERPDCMSSTSTTKRKVHLFDSFAGFPELSEHDGNMKAGGWKAGDTACSLADVKLNMRNRWMIPDELLVYHEGWFADTIPEAIGRPEPFINTIGALNRIAVLRIDCDLYESTKTVMQHLYPLVSPGGIVICDDWNLDGCRKSVMESVIEAPIMWRVPQ